MTIRAPRASDGAAMWALVREAGTLDLNSAYLYVLFADRFADTCAIAERAGHTVGVLTGFRPPRDPSTYFVWQIGVRPEVRGSGLAGRLIDAVLARHPDVRFVEATVSPSNAPSLALFGALARRHGAPLETLEGYGAELFPFHHEREPLLRIGPLADPSHPPPRSSS